MISNELVIFIKYSTSPKKKETDVAIAPNCVVLTGRILL